MREVNKVSANYTEANYENSVIELFRNDLGYEYVYGPDIERDFYNPLYEDVLLDSLYRLNRNLPDDAIQDALFKLKNFENGELVQKNAAFMDYLQNGIPVRYFVDGEERSSIVYLVDYKNPDNNSFIIANQWTFIENSNKRPDVILFLNGLPVVLVELKSPSREETDASEAYRQLRNYMQEIQSMFIYNAICVMSDQLTSKAGTITSGEDRFMEWKTKDGDYENTQFAQFDTFFEGMFKKERLLDIIKNFICFSNEGINSFKILAGYHQYFAVRKAIESTKHATVSTFYISGHRFLSRYAQGKIVEMLMKSTSRQLQSFRGILFVVYRHTKKGEFDEADIEAMKQLLKLIEVKLNGENQWDKIQLMQINWLKSNLNQFIGQME